MHPGDHADAVLGRVRLQEGLPDGVGVGDDRVPDHLGLQVGRVVQGGDDLLGLDGDLVEGFGAVQALASGEEPDLRSAGGFHDDSSGQR